MTRGKFTYTTEALNEYFPKVVIRSDGSTELIQSGVIVIDTGDAVVEPTRPGFGVESKLLLATSDKGSVVIRLGDTPEEIKVFFTSHGMRYDLSNQVGFQAPVVGEGNDYKTYVFPLPEALAYDGNSFYQLIEYKGKLINLANYSAVDLSTLEVTSSPSLVDVGETLDITFEFRYTGKGKHAFAYGLDDEGNDVIYRFNLDTLVIEMHRTSDDMVAASFIVLPDNSILLYDVSDDGEQWLRKHVVWEDEFIETDLPPLSVEDTYYARNGNAGYYYDYYDKSEMTLFDENTYYFLQSNDWESGQLTAAFDLASHELLWVTPIDITSLRSEFPDLVDAYPFDYFSQVFVQDDDYIYFVMYHEEDDVTEWSLISIDKSDGSLSRRIITGFESLALSDAWQLEIFAMTVRNGKLYAFTYRSSNRYQILVVDLVNNVLERVHDYVGDYPETTYVRFINYDDRVQFQGSADYSFLLHDVFEEDADLKAILQGERNLFTGYTGIPLSNGDFATVSHNLETVLHSFKDYPHLRRVNLETPAFTDMSNLDVGFHDSWNDASYRPPMLPFKSLATGLTDVAVYDDLEVDNVVGTYAFIKIPNGTRIMRLKDGLLEFVREIEHLGSLVPVVGGHEMFRVESFKIVAKYDLNTWEESSLVGVFPSAMSVPSHVGCNYYNGSYYFIGRSTATPPFVYDGTTWTEWTYPRNIGSSLTNYVAPRVIHNGVLYLADSNFSIKTIDLNNPSEGYKYENIVGDTGVRLSSSASSWGQHVVMHLHGDKLWFFSAMDAENRRIYTYDLITKELSPGDIVPEYALNKWGYSADLGRAFAVIPYIEGNLVYLSNDTYYVLPNLIDVV